MDKNAIDKIMERVVKNLDKLDACEGPHEFVSIESSETAKFSRLKCTKCGGTIDSSNAIWYNRGLEHGKKLCKTLV